MEDKQDTEMQEYFEERTSVPLPEAPASANMKCWIDGYGVMFTFRGNKPTDVIEQITKLITLAKQNGWKTDWNDTPAKTVVAQKEDPDPGWVQTGQADWCAIHSVKMKQYSKEGKSWYSHQTPDGGWCSGKSK